MKRSDLFARLIRRSRERIADINIADLDQVLFIASKVKSETRIESNALTVGCFKKTDFMVFVHGRSIVAMVLRVPIELVVTRHSSMSTFTDSSILLLDQ